MKGENTNKIIRSAQKTDAAACLEIYRPFVTHSAISFEDEVPSIEQMSQRISQTTANYSWLVCESGSQFLGYAYASSFRSRPAYYWTVEVTIYLANQARGLGIGEMLYENLFGQLIKQDFYTAIAVVTEPNPLSVKFHRKMGFEKIGVFKATGYKLGKWHDVSWWSKQLRPYCVKPVIPANHQ